MHFSIAHLSRRVSFTVFLVPCWYRSTSLIHGTGSNVCIRASRSSEPAQQNRPWAPKNRTWTINCFQMSLLNNNSYKIIFQGSIMYNTSPGPNPIYCFPAQYALLWTLWDLWKKMIIVLYNLHMHLCCLLFNTYAPCKIWHFISLIFLLF